ARRKHENGFNWDWRRQLSISFKIYVPKEVNTHLETSGGSIHLDNLSGDEKFSTSGGSLHLDRLTGTIKGETSGGSIEVSNSSDNINLETSGGSVRANNCQGKIRLETSGGSLHLESLKGTINANTSGGSVRADVVHAGKYIKLDDSGGHIELRLPAKQGYELNLSANRISKPANMSGFNGEWEKDHVRGSMNGGGTTVNVDASGHLDISFN